MVIYWTWYQWVMAIWLGVNVLRSVAKDGQWSYTPPTVGIVIIVAQFWLLGQTHFWSVMRWPQYFELIIFTLAFAAYVFLPKRDLIMKTDVTSVMIATAISIWVTWSGGFWLPR